MCVSSFSPYFSSCFSSSFLFLSLLSSWWSPEARSAGALAGCVCNERASERWVLQWWRRGEVLEREEPRVGVRRSVQRLISHVLSQDVWNGVLPRGIVIFEDAGCGQASILSTRRSKARRSMSGRRQICDWRCYRHGGRHVW
ncbi:hypothetical protein B0H13DRAFT_2150143, partial [Mycena leptocephala]